MTRSCWGFTLLLLTTGAVAQGTVPPAFAVATIRPSTASVKFERDGNTEVTPGHIVMHDVLVSTCIRFAYGVQRSQVVGPASLEEIHYDIEAKADEPVPEAQMKLMMRTLLTDRFGLTFHRERRELHAFAMVVAKGGAKIQPAQENGEPYRQNSAVGTVVRNMTMQQFADFMSDPLQTPIVDKTGLPGKYDFTLDFTSYIPPEERTMRPDMTGVIMAALQGELGLKLESQMQTVEVLVVDHMDKPSEN